MKIKVAVGYARRSSKSNPKSSIPNQILMIEEYCKKNNICLKEIYIDDCKSGRRIKGRDQYLLLKEHIKAEEEINMVVVAFADRLGREAFEFIRTVEEIRKSRLELICIYEGISSESVSPMQLVMLAIQAEFENNQRMQRVQNSKEQLLRQGIYSVGGTPPFGYQLTKERRLIPIEEEAEVVKWVFEKYSKGLLLSEILFELKSWSKIKNWTRSNIEKILLNKTYTGFIFKKIDGKKGLYEQLSFTPHPPIITNELFDDCVKLMVGKQSRSLKINFYFLSCGLLRCSTCKASVKPYMNKYYHCPNCFWKIIRTFIEDRILEFLLEEEGGQADKHFENNKHIISNKNKLEVLFASGKLNSDEFDEAYLHLQQDDTNNKIKMRYTPLIKNKNLEHLKQVLMNDKVSFILNDSGSIEYYKERT